jgi:hypothetical protein
MLCNDLPVTLLMRELGDGLEPETVHGVFRHYSCATESVIWTGPADCLTFSWLAERTNPNYSLKLVCLSSRLHLDETIYVPTDLGRPANRYRRDADVSLLVPILPEHYDMVDAPGSAVALRYASAKLSADAQASLSRLLSIIEHRLVNFDLGDPLILEALHDVEEICSRVTVNATSGKDVPLTYIYFYEWWTKLFAKSGKGVGTDNDTREQLLKLFVGSTKALLRIAEAQA